MRGKALWGVALAAALALTGCGSDSNDASDGGTAAGTGSASGNSTGGTTGGDGGSAPSDQGPATGGTFTIAFGADPGNLDPAMTTTGAARETLLLAYDTLVVQEQSGEYVGGLAAEWEVAESGITFELQDGVTCSDGSAFTAQDVADNINFITDPENLSPLLGTYLQPGVSARADGDLTVVVETESADPFLLNSLTHVMMVCRAGLDDRSLLAQDTIGTGLWDLDAAVPDDRYEFVRREGYEWGPDLTAEGTVPDKVVVRVITNETTAANLLLSGEINMARIGAAEASRVAHLDRQDEKYPSGQTYFHEGEGRITADPDVRRALAMATDVESLGRVATGGEYEPSQSLVVLQPGGCPFVDTVTPNAPQHDPAGAAELLDKAGWTLGSDGVRSKDGQPLELDFVHFGSEGEQVAAAVELLGMQWAEAGVTLNARSRTDTQMSEILWGTGDWDVAWVPVGVATPSQMRSFFSGPAAPEGANFADIQNAEYDENADIASQLADVDEACAAWLKAEEAVISRVDVFPMFDTVTSAFFNGGSVRIVAAELQGWSVRLT